MLTYLEIPMLESVTTLVNSALWTISGMQCIVKREIGVLKAVDIITMVLCHVTPCCLVDRCFIRTVC